MTQLTKKELLILNNKLNAPKSQGGLKVDFHVKITSADLDLGIFRYSREYGYGVYCKMIPDRRARTTSAKTIEEFEKFLHSYYFI